MNKKGFTLIELIGVITVLSILGLITISIVSGVLGKNASKIDEDQEKMIISAAKSYALANAFKSVECVSVSKLMTEGYLDEFENIKGNSKDVDYKDYKVIIRKSDNTYEYEVSLKTEEDSCDE